MIGRLVGTVVSEEPDGAVCVDVGGVGYDLSCPVGAVGRCAVDEADGTRLVFVVHTHVREEAFDLFGFASEQERRVFRLLLRVPNVGPKTALGVLSALPIEDLGRSVREGNPARLGKIPGIGKKTAERVVLELRGKLTEHDLTMVEVPAPEAPATPAGDEGRLLAALTNMGYRPTEAARAVKALKDDLGTKPVAELLRDALQVLTPG